MRRILASLNKPRLARPRGGMSMTTNTSSNTHSTDYAHWSPSDLIFRVTALESQLREQNARLSELLATLPASAHHIPPSKLPEQLRQSKAKKPVKTFDFSAHPTRHIALKFAYLGSDYNGLEHANGTATPLPTIEEVLWKALRKARLIDPNISAEGGAQLDLDHNVIWDTRDRAEKYIKNGVKLDLSWEGCQYSKCGRTDRGVSAFGQVVGVRVRSRIRPQSHPPSEGKVEADYVREQHHEFAYASILNSILPPTIRILAVCLDPPADFDARFSCKERRYRYFFTNPAFTPTPGPTGLRNGIREGWLDIEKMRDAARRLEGLHDFRNFCKVDPSKQNGTHDRRITYADIEDVSAPLGIFGLDARLGNGAETGNTAVNGEPTSREQDLHGPKVYTFTVHGSAFLWHQVRCMVAVLFLVGQGLEDPSVVDHLLEVKGKEHLGRPNYDMADDGPLVLWDCIFDAPDGGDGLKWIYVGDKEMLAGLTTKTDGKFGLGGLVDECWGMWRKAKVDEALRSQLLGMVLGQGDGSALNRGGAKSELVNGNVNVERSTKVFDGSDKGRLVGRYVSVMERPKLDSVDVQRAKYANGKSARREAKQSILEVEGADDGNDTT